MLQKIEFLGSRVTPGPGPNTTNNDVRSTGLDTGLLLLDASSNCRPEGFFSPVASCDLPLIHTDEWVLGHDPFLSPGEEEI